MKKIFVILCLACISICTLSYPNDNGTAVEEVEQVEQEKPVYVYDLSGKKVTYKSVKSGQVYIWKGKKFIKK